MLTLSCKARKDVASESEVRANVGDTTDANRKVVSVRIRAKDHGVAMNALRNAGVSLEESFFVDDGGSTIVSVVATPAQIEAMKSIDALEIPENEPVRQMFPECKGMSFRDSFQPSWKPDQMYKTPQEIRDILRDRAQRFPKIAMVVDDLGLAADGKTPLVAFKITKNPRPGNDPLKPAVYFNAMHHAREVMGPEVMLDIIDELLAGYGRDPVMTRWIDQTEIIVVPQVNPGGNEVVWAKNPMWRRNPNKVDINRNYNFDWGACKGSSDKPDAPTDDYRGPQAMSEPETKAIEKIVGGYKPVLSISLHSCGEVLLYPFGCIERKQDQRAVVAQIGREVAALIPRDCTPGEYTASQSWETLYPTDGEDVSYLYGVHNVVSMLIELNDCALGFHPPYVPWRDITVAKARPAWKRVLQVLWSRTIQGRVDAKGASLEGANVIVTNAINGYQDSEVINRPLNRDGTFNVVVAPGRYNVNVRVPSVGDESTIVEVKDCGNQFCAPKLVVTADQAQGVVFQR